MPTTVLDAVNATQRHLSGAARRSLNLLGAPIGTADTTLTFSQPLGVLSDGVAIGIDDEVCHVWSADPNARTATVLRGHDGSTPAAHTAGTVVEVNARFFRYAILQELRAEIRSYEPRLFAVGTVDLTTTTSAVSDNGSRGYDLTGVTGEVYRVLEVRRQPDTAGATSWPLVGAWDFDRSLPTTAFPSGFGLFVYEPLASGLALRVTYAKPFDLDPFTSATDLVTDVGLSDNAADIPAIGAAWRLMAYGEATRSAREGMSEPRLASEVPPGTALTAARALAAVRSERIDEEYRRLLQLYGMRGW